MSYRLNYSPECEKARSQLTRSQRRDLDSGMARVCQNPYGCGSSQTYQKDRRVVTCGSVFAEYFVSTDVVLITVVRVHAV
ncbi:hypothetical protein ABIA38_000702 [Embleya sp. AB8]